MHKKPPPSLPLHLCQPTGHGQPLVPKQAVSPTWHMIVQRNLSERFELPEPQQFGVWV